MRQNITFKYISIKQLSWSRLGLTLNIRHNNDLVCSCFFLLTGYFRIKRFWNSSRTVVEQRKDFFLFLYHYLEWNGKERNGREQFGTENRLLNKVEQSCFQFQSVPFRSGPLLLMIQKDRGHLWIGKAAKI